MDKSDWAFVVSILSASVSALGLGWNFWSKFIFPKPSLRVALSHVYAVPSDFEPGKGPSAYSITVTNHGPISATIDDVVLRMSDSPYGKKAMGVPKLLLHPFFSDRAEFKAGLPKELKVGEKHSFYLAAGPGSALPLGVMGVGVADSFGRTTWAPGKHVVGLRKGLVT